MITKSLRLFSILLLIMVSIVMCGCGKKLEPVSSASISEYDDGAQFTHADAVTRGLPISVWGLKGAALTSGPFKGWKIDQDENGAYIGLHVYLISKESSSSVQDFFKTELSSDDKWEKGKDVSGEGYSGFSWKRGSQAFVAVIIEDSPARASDGSKLSMLITYLLNK